MSSKVAFGYRDKSTNVQNKIDNDNYDTPEHAVQMLIDSDEYGWLFSHPNKIKVLEPCVGHGNMVRVLKHNGFKDIVSNDINRKFRATYHEDYLTSKRFKNKFDIIITNPPFDCNYHAEFIRKAIDDVKSSGTVFFLLKLLYYESTRRKQFFKVYPPNRIMVFSKRLNFCGGVGICYAWYSWSKGNYDETIISLI